MKHFTKQQKKVLWELWNDVVTARTKYYDSIEFIEQQAKHILDIDIEVFHADGEPVGWGDYNRKYKLIQENRSRGKK